ncbi:MAG: hypothetical protein ACRD2J_16060 [Thermoanaerobaculia bacterium]
MSTRLAPRIVPLILPALLAIASVAPVRSYDTFWHLATGRWIAENGALPGRDPFGLASDSVAWHNGEWLFQLALHAVHALGGTSGLSIARGLFVALLFTAVYLWTRRETTPAIALTLCAVAWAGADWRFDVRPETAGVAFAAFTTALLLGGTTPRRLALLAATTVLWMNVHPSALLAPAIAGAIAVGRLAAGRRDARTAGMDFAAAGVAALALLANPYGLEGILAPIRLARIVSSGAFTNAEWLPSAPATFPLLYLTIVAGIALFAWRRDRSLAPHVLLFVLFAALAVRYVRNHAFFFVILPLVLAPAVPRSPRMRIVAVAAALLAFATVPLARGIGLGADRDRFPAAAVDQLEASGLRGNVYNPDQFGGYLIWRLWPERRVLVDGRNELYLSFLASFPRALRDSRAWNDLFETYDLTLAVEEYRPGTIPVTNAITGDVEQLRPSRVYFPRATWALVGFDDVAMVFARRDAYEPEVLAKLEYRALDPEALAIDPAADAVRVARELARARSVLRSSWRLRALEERAD